MKPQLVEAPLTSFVPQMSRAGGARKVPARYSTKRAADPALARALRTHRQGQLDSAIAGYQQHLASDEGSLDGWLNLGSAYALQGDALRAQAAFDRALRLSTGNGRALRDIGIGLATLGALERALECLQAATVALPTLVGAWLHLARIRLEVVGRKSAIEAALRATELSPRDASAHFVLARCAFEHDGRDASLQALQASMRCARPRDDALPLYRALHPSKSGLKPSDFERDTSDAEVAVGSQVKPAARLPGRDCGASDFAEAMRYLGSAMKPARLFSGAHETLRFAANQARPGTTVELGVRHGVSLRWLAAARGGGLHGFDTFTGLPEDWLAPAGAFSTAHQLPRGTGATLWVGRFADRLPEFVKQHPEPLALLHVDSDLYASAKTGLALLAPSIVAGTVIAFDEYFGHRGWRGDEFRAFQEFCNGRWRYQYLAANPFTGQAVVQVFNA